MASFLERLGIEHPIILAPMGGGPGTPELIAAVANAGGLGSLGAAYLAPDAIREQFARIRGMTKRPVNINLFAGGRQSGAGGDSKAMLAILAGVHEKLGIAPPELPATPADRFAEELEVVLALRPEVFSFTFGVPTQGQIERVQKAGIVVLGTATTAEEARILANSGVDAVVAQGAEAGAHRGTFGGAFDQAMVPTLDLVAQIARAVAIPVIASGGLMDGRDIARAIDAGAVAAQLGTAFLVCPESGAPEAHKRAMLAAKGDTTVITRAFSGRPARGLRNRFIDIVPDEAILPFPLQNSLKS